MRLNGLGILVDASHADSATLHDIVATTSHPIVASHAGAKKIEAFDRFLDDAEILAVAGTGGLIGLWPYHYHGHGPADIDNLMRHARHIADLTSPEHLCIGTDMNGVPGVMDGYRSERDLRFIAERLATNFGSEDVDRIMGGNFMRVFAKVTRG
jgi:membrane dipeptidase